MKSSFIFDTNTLISVILSPSPTNALAIRKAEEIGRIVYSSDAWDEFHDVLFRKKFDKYFSTDIRKQILIRLASRFEKINVVQHISVCRDPEDDKFISLAISSKASCIITGDLDLLILNPFKQVNILNATDFLNKYSKDFL